MVLAFSDSATTRAHKSIRCESRNTDAPVTGCSKLTNSSRICLIALRFQLFIAFTERKKKVPFSMAIGNGELVQECFHKHLRMGTARMKKDKETDEGSKKRGVSMEKSKAGTKKKMSRRPITS